MIFQTSMDYVPCWSSGVYSKHHFCRPRLSQMLCHCQCSGSRSSTASILDGSGCKRLDLHDDVVASEGFRLIFKGLQRGKIEINWNIIELSNWNIIVISTVIFNSDSNSYPNNPYTWCSYNPTDQVSWLRWFPAKRRSYSRRIKILPGTSTCGRYSSASPTFPPDWSVFMKCFVKSQLYHVAMINTNNTFDPKWYNHQNTATFTTSCTCFVKIFTPRRTFISHHKCSLKTSCPHPYHPCMAYINIHLHLVDFYGKFR